MHEIHTHTYPSHALFLAAWSTAAAVSNATSSPSKSPTVTNMAETKGKGTSKGTSKGSQRQPYRPLGVAIDGGIGFKPAGERSNNQCDDTSNKPDIHASDLLGHARVLAYVKANENARGVNDTSTADPTRRGGPTLLRDDPTTGGQTTDSGDPRLFALTSAHLGLTTAGPLLLARLHTVAEGIEASDFDLRPLWFTLNDREAVGPPPSSLRSVLSPTGSVIGGDPSAALLTTTRAFNSLVSDRGSAAASTPAPSLAVRFLNI
jgi:hypothetical protein